MTKMTTDCVKDFRIYNSQFTYLPRNFFIPPPPSFNTQYTTPLLSINIVNGQPPTINKKTSSLRVSNQNQEDGIRPGLSRDWNQGVEEKKKLASTTTVHCYFCALDFPKAFEKVYQADSKAKSVFINQKLVQFTSDTFRLAWR